MKLLKWLFLSILLSLTIPMAAQKNSVGWKESFINPPNQYRPMPFWHLNGKLTTAGIEKQINAAKVSSGFGGVTVLPVSPGLQHPTGFPCPGMEPEFLSDAYFARYTDILENARKLGMQVVLYDDIDFPSGMAGNKMKELYPEDTRKQLNKIDSLVSGPLKIDITIPKSSLMAAIAINTRSSECQDLSGFVSGQKLTWNVPSGSWHIMIFYCSGNGDKLVDYMNPISVKKYIPLTYGKYETHFSKYFGNTLKQIFFDDVGFVALERGWTDGLNDKFREKTGKDPSLYYPALWGDIGSETSAARVAFYDSRAELLAEGYPRLIGEWCDKNGLLSSGHPPGNYEIQPTDMSFDVFKFYRHTHIPLMDYIFYHTHGRDGFKLISSAADVYDRPVVAAEIDGAFLEVQFDSLMLYRTAMDVFTRGVNFLIPHGMWYDYRPEAVRIPPLISSYSAKIAPALPGYSDFVARSCFMLQGGRRVSDFAIFYPIASLQAYFTFNSGKPWGTNAPAETDYLAISEMLTRQLHRDFTFIHPETWVSNKCILSKNGIELDNKENKQSFKVLILPGGKVISLAALKKIKTWYDQGGKLIATSMLPSQSSEFGLDEEIVTIIKEMFDINPLLPMPSNPNAIRKNSKGGQLVFIPKPDAAKLSSSLDQMGITADLVFETLPKIKNDKTEIAYIHKIRENKNIYYIANSTDTSLRTFVELRGNINPEFWYPENGKTAVVSSTELIKHGAQIYTRFWLELPPVRSVFIVEKEDN